MFFMHPGAIIIEIIPWPLCNCKSPDYFYGVGGFYHGSALALGLRHHAYCLGAGEQVLHENKKGKTPSGTAVAGSGANRCSWRSLHAVESVTLDPTRFASIFRAVERELIAGGIVQLTKPIINMNPHANG